MLETVALILSIAAYAAFYAGAPGRQSRPVGPPRLLLGMGTALTLAALVMASAATGSAIGPVVVVTMMMTVASILAITGPFVLPEPEATRTRSTARPKSTDRTPTRPVKRPSNPPPSPDR
jgi:hypothetical protein